MIRVLVVDDEENARDRLKRVLEAHADVLVVDECKDGVEAVEWLRKQSADLVFMDINMPGMDGLSAIRACIAENRMALFVLATAHSQFAVDAFEVGAIDYLLKPFSRDRLAETLRRVRAALPTRESEGGRLRVRDGSEDVFVPLQEIRAFVSDQKYTRFFWNERELLVRESLEAILEQCASIGFQRLSRNAIGQLRSVRSFDHDSSEVVFDNGERAPVSRRLKSEVLAKIKMD